RNNTAASLVKTASVPAGNTVFVTVAMDAIGNSTGATVSDSAGNQYNKDADISTGGGTSGVRTLVFSKYLTGNLSGSITVTFPSSVNAGATFFYFNGLVSPTSKDRCHTATGSYDGTS